MFPKSKTLKSQFAVCLLVGLTGGAWSSQADEAVEPTPEAGTTETVPTQGESSPLPEAPTNETATTEPATNAPIVDAVPAAASLPNDEAEIGVIFDRYIESLGGERAIRKITSRITRGSYDMGGQSVDFETQAASEGRYSSSANFPNRPVRQAYDGTNSWKQVGSEPWLELGVPEAAYNQFSHDVQGVLRWREECSSVKLAPDTLVNGRPARVVKVTHRSGQTEDLCFDTGTHRLVRTLANGELPDGSRADVESTFSDFREVDGLVEAFAVAIKGGSFNFTGRVRSIQHNGAVNLASFSPPKGKGTGVALKESERFFESLTIGELTYSNVWVHRQTNANVLIRHAGGIQTIKLTDLPKGDLDSLRPQLGSLADIDEPKQAAIVTRFIEMQDSKEYREKVAEQYKVLEQLAIRLIIPALALLVALHFLTSFFIYSICKKTKTKTGFDVWLPILNQCALMRAAGMPGIWPLLGFMAPLIPVAVFIGPLVEPASLSGLVVVGISVLIAIASALMWVVWCFKICVARQKNGWLGLLLLIPGVNVITFTYLAFAD